MRVLIIGVNGFIGKNLAKTLRKKHEIYGTSSKDKKNKYCIDTFNLKIGGALDIHKPRFDWVIHCVYDKKSSSENNINSTISWAESLKKSGCVNQIFISSLSAITGNDSGYSKVKRETESWFIENNMNIIRPGMVVGDGGLFNEIIKKVNKFPILPLISGGKSDVKLIGLNNLIFEVSQVVDLSVVKKEQNIFYERKYILKEVLEKIAIFYDKKIILISVPVTLVFWSLRVFEILRINIGVTSQNVKGLIENDVDLKSDVKYTKDLSQILEEELS